MTNQVGLDTYDSEEKKKSRRIVADYLFKHIPLPSQATVLYLPGPNDYQRKSLLNYGFRNENIFGVDLGANVQAVRDRGAYCIKGSLADVIENWPTHRPIDVILADLCCGLGKGAYDVAHAIAAHNFKCETPIVVYFNMQRGRDMDSNPIRNQIHEQGALRNIKQTDHKHRGLLMLTSLVNTTATIYTKDGLNDHMGGGQQLFIEMFREMHCQYSSYRGTRVVMDSVLFRWHRLMRTYPIEPNKKVVQKIAATLATATRRTNQGGE